MITSISKPIPFTEVLIEDFGAYTPWEIHICALILIIIAYFCSGIVFRRKVKIAIIFTIAFPIVYWLIRYIVNYEAVIEYWNSDALLKPLFLDFLEKLWHMILTWYLISIVVVLLSEIQFKTPEEPLYDKENDPWNPLFNNRITKPQNLQRAFKANLDISNNQKVLEILQEGIADFKAQRAKMQRMKENWQSLPSLSDKEFQEEYTGYGERYQVYNRSAISKAINIFSHRMYLLDMEIKKCNELYNKVLLKVPKYKGFAQQKDIDTIDGMDSISLEDLD